MQPCGRRFSRHMTMGGHIWVRSSPAPQVGRSPGGQTILSPDCTRGGSHLAARLWHEPTLAASLRCAHVRAAGHRPPAGRSTPPPATETRRWNPQWRRWDRPSTVAKWGCEMTGAGAAEGAARPLALSPVRVCQSPTVGGGGCGRQLAGPLTLSGRAPNWMTRGGAARDRCHGRWCARRAPAAGDGGRWGRGGVVWPLRMTWLWPDRTRPTSPPAPTLGRAVATTGGRGGDGGTVRVAWAGAAIVFLLATTTTAAPRWSPPILPPSSWSRS